MANQTTPEPTSDEQRAAKSLAEAKAYAAFHGSIAELHRDLRTGALWKNRKRSRK